MNTNEIGPFDIRTITWQIRKRQWAVFHGFGLQTKLIYTAQTEQQCKDWLRTIKHQKRIRSAPQ